MTLQKLTTQTFGTTDVDITVDEAGYFSGTVNEKVYHSSTLETLITQLRAAVSKANAAKNVRVPVGILKYGKPVNVDLVRKAAKPGHFNGFHILTRNAQTQKADEPIRESEVVYQPWTESARTEVARLQQAKQDATDALDAFTTARRYAPETPENKYKNASSAEKVLQAAVDAKEAQKALKPVVEQAPEPQREEQA